MTNKKEEKIPFIVSNDLATEIGDSLSLTLKKYVKEDLYEPTVYDKNLQDDISLTEPFQYEDTIMKGSKKLVDNNNTITPLESFMIAKNEMENSHVLFNTDYDTAKNGMVTVDNISDTMILPVSNNIIRLKEIGKPNDYIVQVVIMKNIRTKLKVSLTNILTSMIINYNNSVTRVVQAYITNSSEPVTVFPDLVLLSGDTFSTYWRYDIKLSDIFESILLNESRESLKNNAYMYYTLAETAINELILYIYEDAEKSITENLINYVNNHIAEIDMTVAHDLQIILMDVLHDEVLLEYNNFHQIFNNILTDIDVYWMNVLK